MNANARNAINIALNSDALRGAMGEEMKHIMSGGAILRGYYKGTSLVMALENRREVARFIKRCEGQIEAGLRGGATLAEMEQLFKQQLNTAEQAMTDLQKEWGDEQYMLKTTEELSEEVAKKTKLNGTGDQLIAMWFANIASLLKMKKLPNDDMNGWHIISLA